MRDQQIFLDLLWTVCCFNPTNPSNTGSGSTSKPDVNKESSSHDRKLTSGVSKAMALMLIELVTSDVMYNGIPWPEEDFMKVTIERYVYLR